MYEEMFTQRHPVSGIFTNPYSFKIDPIVLVVENGYNFQIKSFKNSSKFNMIFQRAQKNAECFLTFSLVLISKLSLTFFRS